MGEHAALVSARPRQVKHWLHVLLQLLQQQQQQQLLLQLPPQPQQQLLSLTLAQQQQQPHAPQLMVPLQVLSACFPSSSGALPTQLALQQEASHSPGAPLELTRTVTT